MEAIGVIDIKDGLAVQGKAGERQKYQPVKSRLTDEFTASPEKIAEAFRKKLGLKKLYIADLDAITGNDRNLKSALKIKKEFPDYNILLDGGFKNSKDVIEILKKGIDYAIIATESLSDLSMLEELKEYRERIYISIDLKNSRLIHKIKKWEQMEAQQIVKEIKLYGYQKFIMLDLAHVGTGMGLAEYLLDIKASFPDLEFITGGGIKDYRDVKIVKKAGFSGLLIASAFHSGSLGRAEIKLIEDDSLKGKIAWCITGAGHLLEETLAEIKYLKTKYPGWKIDIYLSDAGSEVLRIYSLYEKLKQLNCEIHKDTSPSAAVIGRLYKGHYDFVVSSPTTSNTAAKYLYGISDTLVTNMMAHAGKAKVPVLVLPTDIEENLVSPAPDKMVDVFPRKIDLDNAEKLKSVERVKVITHPNEVELWLKNYL
ncbi:MULTISPECIES: HisA/HisF-related TIM barrel protein [unclassified Halanaerobium]|uniref:HisA/HisF-related TIM barrel protein n=1 Tax=unclassified Halanaerobium TaxID=2641197 RepID=UPI000DF26D3F|nr:MULTISPECIES: HisA/HisF-related TIM barrel protein [unclassified Halanaerobium]RCW48752.1 HisA/HisF family protein [Halanaerobium sp. MA284_MarDTE_T2]RCW89094.1 HisA/HisF family protein [Halanaerobium sp. DL-01]